MWLSQDEIDRQIDADRAEFGDLARDVRDALRIQVEILRRSPQVVRRPTDCPIAVAA